MRVTGRGKLLAVAAAALWLGAGPALAQPADDEALAESFLEAEEGAAVDCAPGTDCVTQAEADPMSLIDLESDVATPLPRIDAPFGNAVLGPPDADITLVFFADYACHACREAQPVLDRLLAQDPKLRIVYRIIVNEEEGREAAMTSLAVAHAGADWGRFHRALDAGDQPSSASIAKALADSGIDGKTLPQLVAIDGANEAIFEELSNNSYLLGQRNAKAIPAWVIGEGDLLNGYELGDLQMAVAAARAKAGQN